VSDRIRAWVRRQLANLGLRVRRGPRIIAVKPDTELRFSIDLLADHLERSTPSGRPFFVQVGAYDGSSGDPLHALVRRRGWEGILVEPQPEPFSELLDAYAGQEGLSFRNVAIGPRNELRTLFRISRTGGDLPPWSRQVASFERRSLLRHRREIPQIRELIEEIEIRCETFDDLLGRDQRRAVDLLVVDAEGFDDQIVHLFLDSGRAANLMMFEHQHIPRERYDACCDRLVASGYRIALNGPDTLALRRNDGP
jgi:FkbM family methyltransferase